MALGLIERGYGFARGGWGLWKVRASFL